MWVLQSHWANVSAQAGWGLISPLVHLLVTIHLPILIGEIAVSPREHSDFDSSAKARYYDEASIFGQSISRSCNWWWTFITDNPRFNFLVSFVQRSQCI
jgi:hypothetical protein